MNLVFDARTISPHYPGVGRYALGLLRALASQPGVDIRLLVEHGQKTDNWPAGLEHVESAGLRAPAGQILTPLALARKKLGRQAVYHSPYYIYPYLMPLPAVVTLYDIIPLVVPDGFSSQARALYRLTHRLAARRAKRVITLAHAARDEFVQRLGLPANKMVVIPAGHTPTAPAPNSGKWPTDYLLYVGINKPHKNLPRLIDAYARLGSDAPPLLVVGPNDPRYPEARAAAESAGLMDRVRFVGRVPEADLARLYANATLVVFPTRSEGFGFPVLEAMAAGAPVACSDIRVLRELAGESAVYFDPLSVGSIADCLATALAKPDQLAVLGELGRQRAAAYTWQAAAEATLEVYRQALGAAGGAA